MTTAAWHARWDIMELLLEHGADPNAYDNNGFHPLILYIWQLLDGGTRETDYSSLTKSVQMFLDQGLDPNQQDRSDNQYIAHHILISVLTAQWKSYRNNIPQLELLISNSIKMLVAAGASLDVNVSRGMIAENGIPFTLAEPTVPLLVATPPTRLSLLMRLGADPSSSFKYALDNQLFETSTLLLAYTNKVVDGPVVWPLVFPRNDRLYLVDSKTGKNFDLHPSIKPFLYPVSLEHGENGQIIGGNLTFDRTSNSWAWITGDSTAFFKLYLKFVFKLDQP